MGMKRPSYDIMTMLINFVVDRKYFHYVNVAHTCTCTQKHVEAH